MLEGSTTAMHRILIADDDDSIRSVLRDLLEDEGYDVAEAASGQTNFIGGRL